MSMDKKLDPSLGKKGMTYKGSTYDYPLKVGKLKTFRTVFHDVAIELYRKGNTFYLDFYDNKKGLIGRGKITKLDAFHLIKNGLAKKGFNGDIKLSPDDFRKMVYGLDMIFVDQ